MKKLTILLALLFGLCIGASSAQAQTAITTTTLSAAMTNTTVGLQTITVGSETGFAVNGTLWIDGSVYRIVSLPTTTTAIVNSVYRPATHLTSSVVFVVPVGAQYGGPTAQPVGSCIRGGTGLFPTSSPFSIMFNLDTGEMATCRGAVGSRTWVITANYTAVPSDNPPQTP